MTKSLNKTTEFKIFDGSECEAFHMIEDDGTPFYKLAINGVWTHEEAPTLEAIKAIAETYSDTPDEIVWGVINRMEELDDKLVGLLYTTIGYYFAQGRPAEFEHARFGGDA